MSSKISIWLSIGCIDKLDYIESLKVSILLIIPIQLKISILLKISFISLIHYPQKISNIALILKTKVIPRFLNIFDYINIVHAFDWFLQLQFKSFCVFFRNTYFTLNLATLFQTQLTWLTFALSPYFILSPLPNLATLSNICHLTNTWFDIFFRI